MKQLIFALVAISLLILGLPKDNNAATQVRIEPYAGIYYFTDLGTSSVGSGIALTVGKEVGKVQENDSLLGLKLGVAFINPEAESVAKSKNWSCTTTTTTEGKGHKSKTTITKTCSAIPVRETLHLTNFNASWIAETEYNEKVSIGWEMGVDVWSSNMSSSDLGVRFGGSWAYKLRDHFKLKVNGLYSGLAEAKVDGQEIDISNFNFNVIGEWQF